MNKPINGFTLVELIISMAIGLVIMAAIYAAMNLAQFSSASVGRKVLTQQDARTVMSLMTMEIRMASYDPWHGVKPNLWSTVPAMTATGLQPIVCAQMGLAASVPARKGIQLASANSILIAMDLNADGIIGPPANSEYIRYAYDAGSGTITRNVSCGGDQVVLGGAGSSTMVSNNATLPTATPLFQYFDETGVEIPSVNLVNSPDTNIPLIRTVRINIIAEVETQSSSFNVTKMTYTTDVLVINHALSQ